MDVKMILEEARIKYQGAGSCVKVKCPFHNDKKPSLCVYPEGGFYCFGCGERGPIYKLIAAKKNWSEEEAALWLANLLGEDAGKYQDMIETRKQLQRYIDWAKKNWNKEHKQREHAWNFVSQKITEEGIRTYNIGFHPQGVQYKGAIDKAKLYNIVKNAERYGAIILPIKVYRYPTRVSARMLGGSVKYLHSDNSALSPHRELFNLRKTDKWPIIVEGIFDAIAMEVQGYPSFSPLGLQMSSHQIKQLRGFDSVILMPDGDVYEDHKKLRAVLSNITGLVEIGVKPYIFPIKDDPDDFVRNYKGNIYTDPNLLDFVKFIDKYYSRDRAIQIFAQIAFKASPNLAVYINTYTMYKYGLNILKKKPKPEPLDPRLMYLILQKILAERNEEVDDVPEVIKEFKENVEARKMAKEIENRIWETFHYFVELPTPRLKRIIQNIGLVI